ncbi:hypothetical protein XA68_10414 [Ophiocordyceps unilateralis]|uniref:Uncharacterized protein n=1 Tax=Ophiocordyceps unilateralis TaxID=268505 RepID=A0A2A9PQU8_OPHUN|nr:hypothetical protein XA68_10414 [Ophiocordyceps unilateralis]
MGQSLLTRLQAKLELFRLEQRYTRHRNRRSTFVSNAVYVDGEYIHQTPVTTGSSAGYSTPRVDALHGEPAAGSKMTQFTPPERKRLSRFSSMTGFGSSFVKDKIQIVERPSSVSR